MISKLRPGLGRLLTEPIVRLIARTGISPNALTITGFLLNALVAGVLAGGYLFLGGFLVLFAGWFDMLDGALARISGKSTRFGTLLDSTVDRFSEAVVFLGLLVFYLAQGATLEILLIYFTIVGSIMVSYVRARAEGLGLRSEVGLFARPERVILLALGLLPSRISPVALLVVLWILAVGTMITVLHRLIHTWRQMKDDRS
ncbi:MAG: CDP-alcohol phosphatidyltransferase family protein [Dehalococcoidia bacterium]|nr:CDP-alcohol phosphatidyltransferase family protein [Dehalococcoidia bacterium]MCL0038729.1 CDP-alcohol phosphatidyltransferase family protein [Dehalococcoidia bacterium]MCL0092163.1 CDP-alcohol phosphatidyltransferase family protein [Dehalococcoidia bacterium]MCL0098862.1 CDP-alcohol phosphatidyltransferase family protein [Dehalococcoidia bacterium]